MQKEEIFLNGPLIFHLDVYKDERGFFMKTKQKNRYKAMGIAHSFVQDNVSQSKKNVIRGLHFQKEPYEQGKLVMVLSGRVWDVAVDIRRNSQTFGKWYGVELSSQNHKQFWIPPGFAHGFVALEEDTVFLYKCTAEYQAQSEGSLRWDDPDIGIAWPVSNREVRISPKDETSMSFEEYRKQNI